MRSAICRVSMTAYFIAAVGLKLSNDIAVVPAHKKDGVEKPPKDPQGLGGMAGRQSSHLLSHQMRVNRLLPCIYSCHLEVVETS